MTGLMGGSLDAPGLARFEGQVFTDQFMEYVRSLAPDASTARFDFDPNQMSVNVQLINVSVGGAGSAAAPMAGVLTNLPSMGGLTDGSQRALEPEGAPHWFNRAPY